MIYSYIQYKDEEKKWYAHRRMSVHCIQPNTTIHYVSFFFRNGIEFLFFYLPLEKHFFLFLLELFYSICVGMLNGQ